MNDIAELRKYEHNIYFTLIAFINLTMYKNVYKNE